MPKHNSIVLPNGKVFRVKPAKPFNYQEMVKAGKMRRMWKEDYRQYLFELAKRDPSAATKEVKEYLQNVEIRKINKIMSGKVKPAKPREVVD